MSHAENTMPIKIREVDIVTSAQLTFHIRAEIKKKALLRVVGLSRSGIELLQSAARGTPLECSIQTILSHCLGNTYKPEKVIPSKCLHRATGNLDLNGIKTSLMNADLCLTTIISPQNR